MNPLLPVLLLVVVALLVAGGMIVVPAILAPKRRTDVKEMPYESGMDPVGNARGRFDVRFYLVAIVFLIFDVELLFLYPWAVASWNKAGVPAAARGMVLGEIVVFIVLLGLAYVYAWRRGVFRWR